MMGMTERHICSCGDCAVGPFADRCRFEDSLVTLEALVDTLSGMTEDHAEAALEYLLQYDMPIVSPGGLRKEGGQ